MRKAYEVGGGPGADGEASGVRTYCSASNINFIDIDGLVHLGVTATRISLSAAQPQLLIAGAVSYSATTELKHCGFARM